MARTHRDCGNYLQNAFEVKMSALQKKDKSMLNSNSKKYKTAVQNVENALAKVEEKHKQYRELLKRSRKMAEPGWKPKSKQSFFGSKKEPEAPEVIIARTHAELQEKEREYRQAVNDVNHIQQYRERVIEEVKEQLSSKQMLRIQASC